ncbi:MAG: DUF86 domain-containing protein [Bradymonadaceae bacterium]
MREVVRTLRELAELDRGDFVDARHDRWAAERGLQLAAESTLDIGSHILVSHLNETPDTYDSIVDGLAERNVIDDELGERMSGLGRFRNILVHDYLEVDAERLYDFLTNRLDDFLRYADQIEAFVDGLD